MPEQVERPTQDILFAGATRPAMVMGVTMEVFLLNGMLSAIIFLAAGNPLYIFIGIPLHALAYMVCLNEPRQFKLIFLKLKCIMNSQTRQFWQCNSYSPFNKYE